MLESMCAEFLTLTFGFEGLTREVEIATCLTLAVD